MKSDDQSKFTKRTRVPKKETALLKARIQELTVLLAERNTQLSERESQLSELYLSGEWKLAQLIRKVGAWLVPPNSWREKVGQYLLSFIMGIDFFWNLFLSTKPIYNKIDKKPERTDYPKKNNSKSKIGYVIPGTLISGGVAVICEHVNRLILRGHDVSIISADNLDSIHWFPNQLASIIPVDQISRGTYDILVATGWLTAYTVQKLDAHRKFYFVQSDESRFYPPGDFRAKRAKKTYQMNFEFITMAKWLQDWLKKEYGKSSIYIPNGINEQIMFPDKPIEDRNEKVRVLLEGPINLPHKGMPEAFMAVNGLDCEVWCVSSSGRPKSEWKCDRFFGKVPFGQMRHIYSSCDILLKMSRVESFSYPPLEMMACGGTAVVGEVSGIDEYVIDGHNALVVAQGDIQGAHNALKMLIENEELRTELSTNGRKTAERFRWETSIDMLEDMFFK